MSSFLISTRSYCDLEIWPGSTRLDSFPEATKPWKHEECVNNSKVYFQKQTPKCIHVKTSSWLRCDPGMWCVSTRLGSCREVIKPLKWIKFQSSIFNNNTSERTPTLICVFTEGQLFVHTDKYWSLLRITDYSPEPNSWRWSKFIVFHALHMRMFHKCRHDFCKTWLHQKTSNRKPFSKSVSLSGIFVGTVKAHHVFRTDLMKITYPKDVFAPVRVLPLWA